MKPQDSKQIVEKLNKVAKEIQDEYYHDDDFTGGYTESPGKKWCTEIFSILDTLEQSPPENSEMKSTEEIVKEWRLKDPAIPHWMTVKHAIKAAEEYASQFRNDK